jgi:ATP-dependent DNA helicase RecG
MAIPVNIEDLINQRIVESNRVEFKKSWNPTEIIHSICAFANDIDNVGGGYIVIGVEEKDGSPIFPILGIEKSKIDGILKECIGYCHCIEPLYNPIIEPAIYKDKYIIVIWVTAGYGRPYKASKDVFSDKSNKLYYIRKFSSTIVASPSEEKELFYVSTDIPFDDRPNLSAEVSDLDIGLMRQHLKKVGSSLYELSQKMDTLEIAKNMQLVSGPTENIKPLNVGILMFCEQPEKYFRYARIEVVDIPDPTGTNMVEKVFTGPIQRQLSDALAYIRNYFLKEVVLKENDKAEATRIVNYPYAAVEEILSNAVYHRSYQINEPITVRVSLEGMEITSFPGFDRSITKQDIASFKIRARAYRNRRIGDFLKELKLIEGRNTGYPNALKALKENGSSYPLFKMDDERTYLSVTIPVHPYFLPKSKKTSEYNNQILKAIGSNVYSRTEIASAMGYKGLSAKLSSTIDLLIKTGELEEVVIKGRVKLKTKK